MIRKYFGIFGLYYWLLHTTIRLIKLEIGFVNDECKNSLHLNFSSCHNWQSETESGKSPTLQASSSKVINSCFSVFFSENYEIVAVLTDLWRFLIWKFFCIPFWRAKMGSMIVKWNKECSSSTLFIYDVIFFKAFWWVSSLQVLVNAGRNGHLIFEVKWFGTIDGHDFLKISM